MVNRQIQQILFINECICNDIKDAFNERNQKSVGFRVKQR